ncbi:aspartyl/asparaginyl beta-hydroxylase domain-containing protein [Paludibacterium purpuratum]|uniref:Beta-hydroxylase n=1 Tax=Paludibacterium purpuratum TaxID=1144873 RepID=A0A4R7AYK3_9NEIS|nr:aspartyl/asparaginyl beta-hydroxylase domain-containing protein [Paludibacterium purpuratum]TDR73025.1 beta-hydroxylase [Paludibacterium purpuratum]
MPYIKLAILAAFALATVYIHFRGRVRLDFWRQLSDHSTFMAPINCFLYLFARAPAKPYLPASNFPELATLTADWQRIRDEAIQLYGMGDIKASNRYDDVGFNSFFKSGWKRFYLKWYGEPHPSATLLCPYTTALLQQFPNIKAAMFASLPPGSRLVLHRDPFAGSVRYHLGLVTPNHDDCYIEVDGERYSWRDGQAVLFDETYLHYAENATDLPRIILFCDVERPMWFAPAAWVNRLLSRLLLAAASAPNNDGDRVGGLNRAFHYVQQVRLLGKRIKARNRLTYYVLKWLILAGPIVLWLCWDAL